MSIDNQVENKNSVKKIALLDLKRQYNNLKQELNNAVLKVMQNTEYILGSNVQKFEQEFAEYIGVKYAVSVANGTDALVIALKALGIKPGDEVITSPFTFFATAESISAVGAFPVFVDVEPDTYNINPELIEQAITKKTKAIMPVSIFGHCADFDAINKIADKYNLAVIEDAAQSAGSKYKGKKSGSLSRIACFSFFPTKNLACAGDGGMITTDDYNLSIICKALRSHGSGANGEQAYKLLNNIENNSEDDTQDSQDNTVYNPAKYYNYLIGHNSRLDEIQAAILRVKLKYLDQYIDNRRSNAEYYKNRLKNIEGLTLPQSREGYYHSYHQYVLQSDDRKKVVQKLQDAGVAVGVYYPVPLHLQKVYTSDPDMKNRFPEGSMPVAEYLSKRTFAIPVFPELEEDERSYIADILCNSIDKEV